MARYDNRITELCTLMAQAAAGADARVVEKLGQCIESYDDVRQRALDDLVDLIAKASVGNAGTRAKWESRIKTVRADYNRLFGDSVKDLLLPPPVQLFWFAALQAEDRFFERLSQVKTPQLVDDVLTHQDRLSKLIAELADGWKFVLSTDKALEDDQIRAIREVDEMVQKIISDLDGWHRKLIDNSAATAAAAKRTAEKLAAMAKEAVGPAGEWLETAVKFLKGLIVDHIKPGGLGEDFDRQMDAAKQQAELSAQLLVERVRLHRSLVHTYRSLVSVEKGGVLTVFKKTRDDVNAYIRDNDVAKARVWVDQAEGQLSEWAAALPGGRQTHDAELFCDEIGKLIEDDWRITEDLDEKFRDQFEGVFLSPLSNETVETLAERYLFRQRLEAIGGRGVHERLEDHRSSLPAHAESMEKALQPLDEITSALPPEVEELAKLRNKEFREFVHETIRRQMETLLPLIDELQGMLDPSSLERDFSREELETMLR